MEALEFALDDPKRVIAHDLANMETFLKGWRDGTAVNEWPEFYAWLKEVGR
ncbi:MAG: hypothetical protein ABIM50_13960 [Novosphingobium sp.]